MADVDRGNGHEVVPGQPYGGEDRSADWVGSYMVGGNQVFCVQFEYKAPDTDEPYQPGDELLTKWGDQLEPDIAANMSYLLLRYGDTADPNEAAALAHLLHSWTSPARDGHDDLNPDNDFEHIAYDTDFHLAGLPEQAQQAVQRLQDDAEANWGPWTSSVTAPDDEQTIGTTADWTITVHNAGGAGMADVPVALQLTDATLPDGADTATVQTGPDGTATVQVTPTGENPTVASSLSAPADRPYVQNPVDTNTQRVVATGGEKELTAEASTTAKTKPGSVRVTKLDTKTGTGIAGVALRVTGGDKTSPATGQDDQPLVGDDDKPIVVTTAGDDGTATVDNLQALQEICVVEVGPPDGYDDGFDPNNPPAACGTVEPGDTLGLEINNARNEVPRTIPAGAQPPVTTQSATSPAPSTGALVGLGVLALLGSVLTGVTARRRLGNR